MLCWALISSNKCISDFENASRGNEALPAVNEATNPEEKLQGTDPPEELVEKLWKKKDSVVITADSRGTCISG